MKHMRTPRFWLLTTAALIFGSHMTASAQVPSNYQSGAPTMVAAAPGLPSVPAEQIARDVTSETNPRTGMRELVAAPFDPFEEDPNMAGSLRLRSANGAVAIDGQPLRDGALVEVDFYYNSPSDDQYGGRNYSDASFVNGQLAPVVLRDTRILECSTRVDNVVYDHNSYYSRSPRVGIYRPYRHYSGHYGFGFGFGSSYYGPGYGYYDRGRSTRNRRNFRTRSNRPSSTHRRVLDAVRGGGSSRSNETRSDRNRNRSEDRVGGRAGNVAARREDASRVNDREMRQRARGLQSYGTETPRAGRTGNRRSPTPMRVGNTNNRVEIGTGSAPAESRTPKNTGRRIAVSESKQPEARREQTQRREARRTETRRNDTKRSESRRSETRSSSGSKNRSSSSNRSSSKRSSSSNRSKASRGARSFFDFFPNDGLGYGSRQVVTSRSVDCAREDKLRVFIPNDRLDAARFDGLTLVALDAQGGETPIYIPPNYIEGFRLAASGQVRPQGYQTAPVTQAPITRAPVTTAPVNRYPAPARTIEAAPCPTGTSMQPDGTCLQTVTTGYISR